MKRLRKIIFWLHLPVGVIAGIVILVMSVTGVLLTYEKQITSWADTRGYRSAPPTAETRHLPVETIVAKAREDRGAVRDRRSAPAQECLARGSESGIDLAERGQRPLDVHAPIYRADCFLDRHQMISK